MRLVAHIDADSFYVSCERVRSPWLNSKAVCVLGNQGAIIIARSYEAKKLGAKVGMPVWEAKKLSSEIFFIKRDFAWYGILSDAMQKIFSEFSDTIEYYSIDESFLDLGNFFGDINYLTAEIQSSVLKKTGLPVSVGISLSKTLAKMASDKEKPLGKKVVLKNDLFGFLKSCDVSEVSGIGFSSQKRLENLGIKTAFDFISKDRTFIKNLLHRPGECLWYELKGHSILPVRGERPQRKGISRGGSLYGMSSNRNIVYAFLLRNLEKMVFAMNEQGIELKKISLVLIDSNGRFFKSSSVLMDYSSSYFLLLEALKLCFFKIFNNNISYKALHIVGEDIINSSLKQLNLFSFEEEKFKKMSKIKNSICKKFGVFSIRDASTAYINEVFKDDASNFEISDSSKKFCF